MSSECAGCNGRGYIMVKTLKQDLILLRRVEVQTKETCANCHGSGLAGDVMDVPFGRAQVAEAAL